MKTWGSEGRLASPLPPACILSREAAGHEFQGAVSGGGCRWEKPGRAVMWNVAASRRTQEWTFMH